MGPKYDSELISGWKDGIVTGMKADRLPSSASPEGRNAQLEDVAMGEPTVRRRKGATTVSSAPIGAEILGIFDYMDGTTRRLLLVTNDGGLKTINLSTGAVTALDATAPTPFTSGTNYPDFTVANGMAVIVNGKENKKAVGASVYGFGIAAPSVPTVVDSGVAGTPNGTYEFGLVATNNVTGSQSSLSTSASVAVVAKKITVSWTFPTDPQVTHVQVAVRKATLSPNFYIIPSSGVTVTPAPAVTVNGYLSSTVSITFNASDAELAAMAIYAPDDTENARAPVLSAVEFHKGRVFGAYGTTLIWSKLDQLEAFGPNAYENVGKGDGDSIVALQSRKEGLLILKHHSIWLLTGDNPNDFVLDKLVENSGCVSSRAVLTFDNVTYWWCPLTGPRMWDGEGMKFIGNPTIWPTIQTLLATTDTSHTCVGLDTVQQHVLFSVPGQSQTRNTLILPYSILLNAWMSEYWDPFEVSAMGSRTSFTGQDTLYVGGYLGDLYSWGTAENDGVGTGKVEGTVQSATAAGSATITLTTGGDPLPTLLAGRKVIFEDPATRTCMKFIVGSSNTTSVTLRGAETTTVAMDTTWTWTLGGPDFMWATKDMTHGEWFARKRYTFASVFFESISGVFTLLTQVVFNYNLNPPASIPEAGFANALGDLWDTGLWDTALWGPGQKPLRRFRVSRVANAARVRVSNHQPNVAFTIRAIQLDAEILTDKGVTTDES